MLTVSYRRRIWPTAWNCLLCPGVAAFLLQAADRKCVATVPPPFTLC